MTEPHRDEHYELPVRRLDSGRGQRRRAVAGALSVVVVIGAAIGLARLADRSPSAAPSPATPQQAAAASAGPSATARRSVGPRIERLLDLPNASLSGAPTVVLADQHDLDLWRISWTPGTWLMAKGSVRGALAEADGAPQPFLAPTGDRVLVVTSRSDGAADGGSARLVDADGTTRWRGDRIASRSGALWSEDGRIVVAAGTDRRWHVVTIGKDGRGADRAVVLPFGVFLPSPLPTGWLTIPRSDPRTAPLGFSADGRWIYGATISPELGIVIATFRVAVDGSAVEPVRDLGVGRPDGLVPRPGTLGGRLVDPTTGRIATSRLNPDTSGGPPTLEVRNPDAGLAFVVSGGSPLGSGWDDAGNLIELSTDAPVFPERTTLDRIGPDGTAGPPVLETGPVSGAGLIGIRGGFAALLVSVTRPEVASQLVMVDLADPNRISAVDVPPEIAATLVAADLRP